MRDAATGDGSVGEFGSILVKNNVDVVGTTRVVTWEDGSELDDTVVISLLDTTEESLVQVGRVVRVAVATFLNAYSSLKGDNTTSQHARSCNLSR